MRSAKALFQLVAVVTALAAAGTLAAQDAIPETPPELRDFRLDPQQPRPEPTPVPTVVTPPPVLPTTSEPRAERPRVDLPRPRSEQQPPPETIEPEQTEPTPDPVVPEMEGELPKITVPPTRTVAAPVEADASYQPIFIGLGVLALLGAAAYWLRRRRRPTAVADKDHAEEASEPEPVRTAKPAPVIAATTPPSPAQKPVILLDFIPEKATISFTSLSVKGQLQVVNNGQATAKGMELRAGLMSASAAQNRRIQEFHRASTGLESKPLGDAKPGERIALAIELAVPLIDMESFTVGDQKLLVPIVIANLSFTIDGKSGTETAQLAYMIGREASPPAAKMGPLRLDLGPRSFASLGKRPLQA